MGSQHRDVDDNQGRGAHNETRKDATKLGQWLIVAIVIGMVCACVHVWHTSCRMDDAFVCTVFKPTHKPRSIEG